MTTERSRRKHRQPRARQRPEAYSRLSSLKGREQIPPNKRGVNSVALSWGMVLTLIGLVGLFVGFNMTFGDLVVEDVVVEVLITEDLDVNNLSGTPTQSVSARTLTGNSWSPGVLFCSMWFLTACGVLSVGVFLTVRRFSLLALVVAAVLSGLFAALPFLVS